MKLFLLTLICCSIMYPVTVSASDVSGDTEVLADGTDESDDAASTQLPEGDKNDDAASRDTTVVIDLTEIMLQMDAIDDTLTQLWQHVRFWAVAAFSWWFAKKSFRGVS